MTNGGSSKPGRRNLTRVVRCKGCGRDLVTSAWTERCVFCGKKTNMFRASMGKQKYTRRGQRKAATRAITNEIHTSSHMTWQEAELLAFDWMRRNGHRDAALTKSGADGGIDITSRKAIAQVKHHQKPTGLGEMQRMSGIAASTGRKALFFSSAGYTPKAKEWARQHDIALYQFPPVRRVS